MKKELDKVKEITRYGDFYGMRFGQNVILVNPGCDNGHGVMRFVGYEFEDEIDPSVVLIERESDDQIFRLRLDRTSCVSGRFGGIIGAVKKLDDRYDFYDRILRGGFVE